MRPSNHVVIIFDPLNIAISVIVAGVVGYFVKRWWFPKKESETE